MEELPSAISIEEEYLMVLMPSVSVVLECARVMMPSVSVVEECVRGLDGLGGGRGL
jgi:hypothetical protein